MDFIYARSKRPSLEELGLRGQGWKWVNTNTINATQYGQHQDTKSNNGIPDRLATHSHHGESTHRVISGDLCIRRNVTEKRRRSYLAGNNGLYATREHGGHSVYEISSAPGSNRQDRVQPNIKYSATSKTGCTFVEGHKCLSPESAERFLARGTLEVTDNRRRCGYFPDRIALQEWLRQVKFNPNGKAHPRRWKNERPILDTSRVQKPMPEDVNTDLLEWFENEWHGPKPRMEMELVWVFAAIAIAIVGCFIAESLFYSN
ncbi:hypothetical protein GGR51DRAFT_576051 [Nemania sp. FL0031]|nr:hypothetical protein GGR51DRAFT_576051 [Nemania sp. FL0031]